VLEATVHALCEAAACEPAELQAWLGPCIGPDAFEVGGEVKEAFLAAASGSMAEQAAVRARFRPLRPPGEGTHGAERTQHAQKWLADLPGLASDRLAGLGLQRLALSGLCTHSRPEQLFSYRRDGQTGRMVACIWRLPQGLGAGAQTVTPLATSAYSSIWSKFM
jgi:copper oxidase (laccase) domain-containing protein